MNTKKITMKKELANGAEVEIQLKLRKPEDYKCESVEELEKGVQEILSCLLLSVANEMC